MDPDLAPPDEYVSTSEPAGLVPAAVRYEASFRGVLCDTACTGIEPIVRRPVASRSNYRSGVRQDGPLPGVVGGRDFVTGVEHPLGAGVRRLGF